MVAIRHERPADAPTREALLDLAFGPCRFEKTCQRLRDGRHPAEGLSFVATAPIPSLPGRRNVARPGNPSFAVKMDGRVKPGHDEVVGTVRLWDVVIDSESAERFSDTPPPERDRPAHSAGRGSHAAYDPSPHLWSDFPLLGEGDLDLVSSCERPALLLGPLAVHPDWRARGVGALLMHRALAEASRRGHAAVLLVGDAPYYARFGFSADKTRRLSLPGPYEADRLLARELQPGALAGARAPPQRVGCGRARGPAARGLILRRVCR